MVENRKNKNKAKINTPIAPTIQEIVKAKFKIIVWNCNSIKGKLELFKMLLYKEKPDIVCLTETKCGTAEAYHYLNIKGYQSAVYNRNNFGGGAALLIADKFFTEAVIINTKYVDENVEFVGTRIVLGNKDFTFIAYYNPPWRKPDRKLLKYVDDNFDNYLILGDINCKTSPWDIDQNPNGIELAKILSTTRAQILNELDMPTFYRTINNITYTSTLDLAIGAGDFIDAFRDSKILKTSYVDVYQKSYYHVPVIFNFELAKATKKRVSNKNSLLYFKANWEKFKDSITTNISNVREDEKINMFYDITANIITAAKNSIPNTSTINARPVNYPKHIVELNSLKNYWQRQYTKHKSETAKNNLDVCRNDLIEEIEKHRSLQWQTFLNSLGPNPLSSTPFWKKINSMRGKKAQTNIGTIIIDGVNLNTDKEKADAFAKRLESIFQDDNLDQFDKVKKIEIDTFFADGKFELSYTDKSVKQITLNELIKCIKEANSKTSSDVDGISNRMLKNLPECMIQKLLILYNKCLSEMKVPLEWKVAIVQMISKKSDDPTNIKNFRPISITLCIARLFERITKPS
jgi:exonuclease III